MKQTCVDLAENVVLAEGCLKSFLYGFTGYMQMGRIKRKQPSRLCIGSETYHDEVEGMYQELVEGCDCKEDVSFRHGARAFSVEVALGISHSALRTCQHASLVRPIAAKALCDYAGMT